ncbi:hypothetical protein DFH06DRAFT_1220139 [Mycena polygramma]|nr:hypothetical protein DFH06DRAFT_1220139 [Mycena polygramma]
MATPVQKEDSITMRRGPGNYFCSAFNLNTSTECDGSRLVRAENKSQAVFQCHYSDADVCSYSRGNGTLQPGSTMCPQSINTSESTESHFDCHPVHLQPSQLIGRSVTPTAENLACVFSDGTMCTVHVFSQHTGALSTGASNCPTTAESSADCPVSSTGPTLRPVSGTDLLASASAPTPLSPALITLLTLNGVLVFAVLVLGCVWLTRMFWRAGTRDAKYRSLSLGRKNEVPDAVCMPLTHGATGRYEDESFSCAGPSNT